MTQHHIIELIFTGNCDVDDSRITFSAFVKHRVLPACSTVLC